MNQQWFEEQRRGEEQTKLENAAIIKRLAEQGKKAEKDRDLAIRQAKEIQDQIERDRRKRDEEARREAHRRDAEDARQRREHERKMKEYAAITRQKATQPKFNPRSFEELAVKEKHDHALQLALEAETTAEEARRKLFEVSEADARWKKAQVDAQSTRVLIGLKEDTEEGVAAFKEGRSPVANPRAKAEALKIHDQESAAELNRLEQKVTVKQDEAERVQQRAVAIERAAAEEKGEAEQLAKDIERKRAIEAAREISAARRAARVV